jgi:hypothetical protein
MGNIRGNVPLLQISFRFGSSLQLDSAAGSYLTSCCVFEVLTAQSVLGNSYRLSGMSDEEAASLQHCAHEAKL